MLMAIIRNTDELIDLSPEHAMEAAFFLSASWERGREWEYYTRRLNAIAGVLAKHVKLVPGDTQLIEDGDIQEAVADALLKLQTIK